MLEERDKERLTRHLEFFTSELKDFQKFSEYIWNDYQFDRDKRRNIERWIENLTNSTIDIAKILLASDDFPIPQTYKEILFAFGARYFNEDFGKSIENWAILRNIVTHEYLDIKWNSIKAFMKESKPLLEQIYEKIKEILLLG
ncbi:MAG: DUF86 domain-containing protein [Nitrospinae bacterium]|nr:DUF86 domain-containing protein [Nitrospinota bacterium]MBI3815600.1 DUF86 domain-containing protein [Nitrospinota bacterium]